MWAISSAGDAKSVVLKDIRDSAVAALEEWQRYVDGGIASVEEYVNTHDVSIGIFEWSAPDDCRLDDPDAYLQSNPSIGYGYEVDALLSDLASGEPEHVTRTEVLGIWVTAALEPSLNVEARRGKQLVFQCANCGLIAVQTDLAPGPLGACPACGLGTWWEQTLPVARLHDPGLCRCSRCNPDRENGSER